MTYREGKNEYYGSRLIIVPLPEGTYAALQHADGIVHPATLVPATIANGEIEFSEEIGEVVFRFRGKITDREVAGTQTGTNGFSAKLQLPRVPFVRGSIPARVNSDPASTKTETGPIAVQAAAQREATARAQDSSVWHFYAQGTRMIVPTAAMLPGGFPQDIAPVVTVDLQMFDAAAQVIAGRLSAAMFRVAQRTGPELLSAAAGAANWNAFTAKWGAWRVTRNDSGYVAARMTPSLPGGWRMWFDEYKLGVTPAEAAAALIKLQIAQDVSRAQ
ncbi:hypothetical protein [Roseiterribacter gracilis]